MASEYASEDLTRGVLRCRADRSDVYIRAQVLAERRSRILSSEKDIRHVIVLGETASEMVVPQFRTAVGRPGLAG